MTAAVMSHPVLSFTEAQRRHPDEAMIARIRDRYPTEPEIDAVLTRKMRRRRGDPYKAVPIERLVAGVTAMIGEELGYAAQVSNARWLSGGASKLQMVFDLAWRGLDGQAPESVETLVLRMEPAASVTESSRRREFEVLNAVQGVIPAPRPYWVDAEARHLPYPGMVYAFAKGAAKPSVGVEKVSGLGQNYGPELRAKLAPHFVSLLARLHTVDPGKCTGMASFMQAQAGSNASVIRQVNAYRRIWEEDRIEEEPLLEVVYQWLIAHAPPVDRPSIVHGDYRSGNFLFDEASGEITAWLDWEGAVIGDRHQDLTYATLPTFQHLSENGGSVLASGMMPKDDFYAAYEVASGLPVDPVRIRYFEIFNRYLVCVLTLAASARASLQAGTHQDVLVNFVSQMGHTAIADLRERFLEVTR